MPVFNPSPQITAAKFTVSTAVAAGTRDVCTATNGDIFILNFCVKTGVASTGLVSASVQTNNTTATPMLDSTLLAALTADKVLPCDAFFDNGNAAFLLESGKKVQYTVVGTGTGTGTFIVSFTYLPLTAGAILA